MSEENVEIVRALAARWNAGVRSVPTDLFDPAVELETPISSVAGKPYRGYAGVEEWIRENDEQFSVWRISLPDVREADGKVIAIGSVHARGRASGIEVDITAALIAELGSKLRDQS